MLSFEGGWRREAGRKGGQWTEYVPGTAARYLARSQAGAAEEG